jgi:hypothetical protein
MIFVVMNWKFSFKTYNKQSKHSFFQQKLREKQQRKMTKRSEKLKELGINLDLSKLVAIFNSKLSNS